jgi:hypothetical protein
MYYVKDNAPPVPPDGGMMVFEICSSFFTWFEALIGRPYTVFLLATLLCRAGFFHVGKNPPLIIVAE